MAHRQWLCSLCSTNFTRMEHLRRHIRSHENERPYACMFCQRTFTRKDAMRRHEKICKTLPSSNTALDASIPVSQNERNQDLDDTIVFQRKDGEEIGDIAGLIPDIPTLSDFAALDWLYSQELTPDSIILAERLEFLAYFTSAKGMATFLDQDTLKQRQDMLLEYENKAPGELSLSLEAYILHNPWEYSPEATIDPTVVSMDSNSPDPLCPRTREIIYDLRTLISSKPEKSIIKLNWSLSVQERCNFLFAPHSIRRFLEYFWSLWYPNCPIVHRPSFDLQAAPLGLLCVMVIIGACLSPHGEDRLLARMWLDCVEELVFSNEIFQERSVLRTTPPVLEKHIEWKKRRVECIQMAYLVCSLQKREGSVEAQTRIRRYRHATLVTLARDIGFCASHKDFEPPGDPSLSWWRQFIVEEELIRSLIYVFLIDAALATFHNSPPRMVVSELQMDMACAEECFQAGSATECFTAFKAWKKSILWCDKLSVSGVVRRLCQGSLDDHLVLEFSRMGTLNMFTIVQSLHLLTFNLQNSLIFESTFTPVQSGLENWRRIWNQRIPEDRYTPDRPQTIWKKIGFVRYAPEFWHLARIIVARMQSVSLDEDQSPSRTRAELSRYDHTDMVDVNGLIMEYRRMSLTDPLSK
ncbi:hypothetical protein BDV23DRAFT_177855 [Aspergillus alliaceus]|uniref:C2H2-type domain-containing protein n=1 Tax=Petromyces alliaceus TaxID=209559 RepID=A0A5N7CQB2_PETAA|nr:hypothetical protein BDV23DRAFT_177855 [Aspergillus alliaceus]